MADEWPGDDVEAPPSVIVDIFGDVAPAVVVALPNAGKQRHGRPRTEEFRLTMTSLTNEMLEMVPSACPCQYRCAFTILLAGACVTSNNNGYLAEAKHGVCGYVYVL